MTRAAVVEWAAEIADDLEFGAARAWIAEEPGRKAAGYLPVYAPREVIRACGMLPVGVHGGGDRLEIIRGDAFYQSYICHLPRSTIELGLNGAYDCLDGMLFPATCDVIRNLSGMWQMLFKDKYVRYIDVPQNYEDAIGGRFYTQEMQILREDLAKLRGAPITDAELNASIAVYNDNRAAIRDLYTYRASKPWQAPTSEVYLLLRAGMVLPPEEHTALVRQYLAATEAVARTKRDNARVVINGSFCEQPPLALIKSIEMSGCYIVDDDFMLVTRWLLDDVPADRSPLDELSKAFLHRSATSAAKYDATREEKGMFLLKQVKTRGAEGVVFAAPSFCDPALLERPMLQDVMGKHKVPYTAFKYAENTGQMAPIREQAGTFADSIKLWSAA